MIATLLIKKFTKSVDNLQKILYTLSEVEKGGKIMERTNLKKFRNSLNKSQNEMAKALDITLSFYSKLELGLKNPSLSTIKRFKEIFPTADVEKIFLT